MFKKSLSVITVIYYDHIIMTNKFLKFEKKW